MPGSERPPAGWSGWPDGKQFALVLTHDVESAVGLKNCAALMRLELELGFRSSFNFVPEGQYRVSRELRETLVKAGFEVGIHDLKHDGRLYHTKTEFVRGAKRINHYLREWGATGFRSAFMLHELDWLHHLDIEYDASTFDTDPFEPQPEGRHTIFPFWRSCPAELHTHLENVRGPHGGYVELPYTLPQDSTLFLLLQEKTIDIWLRKLDWIAQHGGMALIDTHPDYMSWDGGKGRAGQYPVDQYREFLQYVQDKYAGKYWHALPREVAGLIHGRYKTTETPAEVPSFDVQTLRSRTHPEAAPALSKQSNGDLNLSTRNGSSHLEGRRAAVVLFSHYPADPRPRRAAEALVNGGVTVDLICLRKNRDELRQEIVNGVNVVRVPVRRRRGGKLSYVRQYLAFLVSAFVYLSLRSLGRKYDIVHVHNMPDVLVFSALLPKMRGARIILDLHDPMPELMQTIFQLEPKSWGVRFLKQLEKWSIGFADSVLTVNRACKRIYSSRSCSPDKIEVILNSPDQEIFQFRPATSPPHSRNGKPFTILYHGSLVRRNGFDLAVDALGAVQAKIPKAKLVVCGERTEFFEEVMRRAEEWGLTHQIECLGIRSLPQIVEAIGNCDLGIIPNHRNIFTEINTPTRIFEYLALGKPVIAPRAPGILDYFNEKDLLFFELGDAADLAQKIEFAFSEPNSVEQIVKRGQQVYLAHTWHQERTRLLNVVGELL